MCSIGAIRLSTFIWSVVRGFLAVYIFSAGCNFVGNVNILRAFGSAFTGYGIGLIFMGLLSFSLIYPHLFANKVHNRFVLLILFLLDMIVFIVCLTTGLAAHAYTINEFPQVLQADCLLNVPTTYTLAECMPYYQSDRLAGMRVLWEGLFMTRDVPTSVSVMAGVQVGCCGFFAPMRCLNDSQPFPTGRLLSGIPVSISKERVICGNKPQYYAQTPVCVDYYNPALINPIIGGCQYDFGAGYCLTQAVTPASSGCALRVENYAVALIASPSIILQGVAFFNLLMMLYQCCLFWKRKESDVFPDSHAGVNIDVEFAKIKDQFEVVPSHNILVREGYVLPEQADPVVRANAEGAEEKQNDDQSILEGSADGES